MCEKHYTAWRRQATAAEKRRPSDRERFAAKTIRDDASGCLIWTAALDTAGYGAFGLHGRVVRAHRTALEWHLGRPLAPGVFVCHRCDNPACVEPAHLFEGTHQENMDDCLDKQRQAWGERNGHHKLSLDDVAEIREGRETQASLARRLGVHQSTVSRVAARKRWANA